MKQCAEGRRKTLNAACSETGDSLAGDSPDRFISIDPSFRRTGICLWDTGPSFHTIKFTAPFKKSFREVYHIAQWQKGQLLELVSHFDPTIAVVEHPPVKGEFTSGMSMLVALILDMVVTLVPTVYLSPPAVGRYIFKKQTWKKRDSKLFARRFAGMSRITDDEADAFVMLVPFFEPDQQDRMGVARYYEYEEVESAGWQRKAKH